LERPKFKLREEGFKLSENIGQLNFEVADGKFYKTDVADIEQLFRLMGPFQSPRHRV